MPPMMPWSSGNSRTMSVARSAFASRAACAACFAVARKVMLMVNQRRRQHFVGQLEEFRGERAPDDRRVLDEIRDFMQQSRVRVNRPAHAALQALRFRIQLARNLVVALPALED